MAIMCNLCLENIVCFKTRLNLQYLENDVKKTCEQLRYKKKLRAFAFLGEDASSEPDETSL